MAAQPITHGSMLTATLPSLFNIMQESVQQKLLTRYGFCFTVITRGLDMANVLNTDKQIAIIGALT
jgi:hypothetical protein